MERGKSVSALLEQQTEWDRNKQDITIDYDHLMLSEPFVGACKKGSDFRLITHNNRHPSYAHLGHRFTTRAKTQFATMHGLSKAHWDHVETEGGFSVRSTFKDHANAILKEGFGYKGKTKPRLVRIYTPGTSSDPFGPIVRGYFSERYGSYTNKQMLEKLEEANKTMETPFNVFNYHHSLDNLIVKMISPSKISHGRGELYAGVVARNSEDGGSSIVFDGFVADSFCYNGLIFGRKDTGSSRQKHLGDVTILQHRVNLMIAEAFQMADGMLDKFLSLKTGNLRSPLEIIDDIVARRKTKPGFSDAFAASAKAIYPSYSEANGDNLFSVVSALTQASQALDDETQFSVEREMGEFVASRV